MTSLRKALLKTTTDACDDTIILTVAQMKELFKLALVAIRQTTRSNSQDAQDVWQPEQWSALHSKLGSSARFKGSPALQKMCDQVVKTSQKSPASSKPKVNGTPVASKRKVDEVIGDEQTTEVIKTAKRRKAKSDKN